MSREHELADFCETLVERYVTEAYADPKVSPQREREYGGHMDNRSALRRYFSLVLAHGLAGLRVGLTEGDVLLPEQREQVRKQIDGAVSSLVSGYTCGQCASENVYERSEDLEDSDESVYTLICRDCGAEEH